VNQILSEPSQEDNSLEPPEGWPDCRDAEPWRFAPPDEEEPRLTLKEWRQVCARVVRLPVARSPQRARSRRSRVVRRASSKSSASSDGEPPSRVAVTFAVVDDAGTRARAVDIIKELLSRAEARR
jgi:hypothetical protein